MYGGSNYGYARDRRRRRRRTSRPRSARSRRRARPVKSVGAVSGTGVDPTTGRRGRDGAGRRGAGRETSGRRRRPRRRATTWLERLPARPGARSAASSPSAAPRAATSPLWGPSAAVLLALIGAVAVASADAPTPGARTRSSSGCSSLLVGWVALSIAWSSAPAQTHPRRRAAARARRRHGRRARPRRRRGVRPTSSSPSRSRSPSSAATGSRRGSVPGPLRRWTSIRSRATGSPSRSATGTGSGSSPRSALCSRSASAIEATSALAHGCVALGLARRARADALLHVQPRRVDRARRRRRRGPARHAAPARDDRVARAPRAGAGPRGPRRLAVRTRSRESRGHPRGRDRRGSRPGPRPRRPRRPRRGARRSLLTSRRAHRMRPSEHVSRSARRSRSASAAALLLVFAQAGRAVDAGRRTPSTRSSGLPPRAAPTATSTSVCSTSPARDASTSGGSRSRPRRASRCSAPARARSSATGSRTTRWTFKARDAHNLYLETLAELGPIGLALLLAVMLRPARRVSSRRGARRSCPSRSGRSSATPSMRASTGTGSCRP